MSGVYKLKYFNLRARGELIRWILASGGLKWEDDRVAMKDWPQVKPTIPGGQLPVLTTPDGSQLTQSVAVARYAAAKAGLVPSNDEDSYRCDMIVATVASDAFEAVMKFAPFLPPEERQKGLQNWNGDLGRRMLGILEGFVKESSSGYLVGDKLTWADLSVASFVDGIGRISEVADSLKAFPKLVEFSEKIKQSQKLSEYLKTRPETDLPL